MKGGTALYVHLKRRRPLFLWVAAIVLLAALLGAAWGRYFSEPLNRYLRGLRQPKKGLTLTEAALPHRR